MSYLEFTFNITPHEEINRDILTALLGEIGFDSFVDHETHLLAYIPQSLFNKENLDLCITNFPIKDVKIEYTTTQVEDKNWNEEWEKNYFQPLIIDDRCIIHSTFHTEVPQKEFNIIINPQMSFGTGHHETTSLMMQTILEEDLNDKTILDIGCGTAILSILAKMKGAKHITAIDIDAWCIKNATENITLNKLSDINVLLGDAGFLQGINSSFDIIFANINRNILLADMKIYASKMNTNGILMMSGFYEADASLLREEATKLNLKEIGNKTKNNWMMLKFQK